MKRRSFIKKLCAACIVTYVGPLKTVNSNSKQLITELETRFRVPMPADRPQVYWLWMNGHVSKDGITKDLEAMNRVGIGGVFNFDAGISIPKGPVAYLSQKWLDLKEHAIRESKRLQLEFVMHNCPGWSSSGGPWITPDLAMKQVTWSEMVVNGGRSIKIQLPIPFHKLNYYRDIAVLAYPSLPIEIGLQKFNVSISKGAVSKKALTGEDPNGVIVNPANQNETAWLLFEFQDVQEVRFITFLVSAASGVGPEKGERTFVELQSSDDAKEFRTIAKISTGLFSELSAGYKFVTYDIEPSRAKYFRLVSTQPRRYSQLYFSGYPRLEGFMEKTGNRFMFSGVRTSPIYSNLFDEAYTNAVINDKHIVNLSSFLSKDGVLHWNAPGGSWTILRFGYTATGAINKAAPENGIGLECDKLSKAAVDFHFQEMMRRLGKAKSELMRHGKAGLEIDSYEAGPQTWTDAFPEAFRLRRNYSVLDYLPAVTGRILHSVDHTERFLWDFRRTQADLIAENYYGRFSGLCHQHGFTSYAEPYDKGPFEEMQIGSWVDVCMGEFWYGLHSMLQGNRAVERTSRLAASMMNTNGRKIVGAESFTSEPESSRWQEYPFSMKALGDKMFCNGVNKLVIHRFAHQPNQFARPGMTMGPWGVHFDRTNTWFEGAGGWLRYMARCQVLLREGWPVKDLLYFTGEEANVYTRAKSDELRPPPPFGFDYDLINADSIIKKVTIQDGSIYLPHGMRYRVLVLQDYKRITYRLLQKLKQLVADGMILVGEKPEASLGLKQMTHEEEFGKIASELWDGGSQNKEGHHAYGKGHVHWKSSLATVVNDLSLKPDFAFSSRKGDTPIHFCHRRSNDIDIYFISNQKRSYEELVCSFRIKDKLPEFWDADNGTITPLAIYEVLEDTIRLPLALEPYGSKFIIFRSPALKESILSIKRDGETQIDTNPFPVRPRKLFNDVRNDFTIEVWAKPEMNIMTQASVHMGDLLHPYTDYYAIYPSSGRKLYGAGHATCGLTIGRNGVGVWENEDYPVLTLVAEESISGWSHIALVYEGGIPSVYIDGRMIARGKKSLFNIHPGLGEVYMEEGASYFNGDMSEPKLFNEVFGKERIGELAKQAAPFHSDPPLVPEVIYDGVKPALLLWQKGKFDLLLSSGCTKSFIVGEEYKPIEVMHNWKLEFPPRSGAPRSVVLQKLHSLHKHQDEGVKYFSGTVIYRNEFINLRSFSSESMRMFLDLGRVEVIAQVLVNGKNVGTLWKRPYLVDISLSVKKGLNQLEIRVTNLWPNRLIGDEQISTAESFTSAGASGFEHLAGTDFDSKVGRAYQELPDWYVKGEAKPDDGRIAFATWKHYSKHDPLLESGLVGPVVLRSAVIPF